MTMEVITVEIKRQPTTLVHDHDHEDGDGDGDGSKQLEDNLQHWWLNGQGSFLQERGRGGGGRGSKEHPGPASY